MKGTILAVLLFTLFSNSFAINDTDVVYEFVNCTIRAMTSGIEGLVPPHNPLHIRNFNITEEILGLSYHIEITNNVLAHLVDVELRQVDVTTYTNPDALNIDYDIYWKVLNFTGDYAWSVEFLGAEIGGNGSYSIAFDHTDFTGLFNLTKPGQADKGIKTHLDDFTLNVSVKEVEVNITGAGPEWLTNEIVKDALYVVMNNVPASVGDALKENRFNEFWIGHPEKLTALVEWCYANP
ncbi:hypothetical protein HUJ05_001259 [Dendroctonus ponderosae]|nr:hypothetical protein HUJ05_001259 [Dendroctonus ponderosae]